MQQEKEQAVEDLQVIKDSLGKNSEQLHHSALLVLQLIIFFYRIIITEKLISKNFWKIVEVGLK